MLGCAQNAFRLRPSAPEPGATSRLNQTLLKPMILIRAAPKASEKATGFHRGQSKLIVKCREVKQKKENFPNLPNPVKTSDFQFLIRQGVGGLGSVPLTSDQVSSEVSESQRKKRKLREKARFLADRGEPPACAARRRPGRVYPMLRRTARSAPPPLDRSFLRAEGMFASLATRPS